jgi:hypothetical protein
MLEITASGSFEEIRTPVRERSGQHRMPFGLREWSTDLKALEWSEE